MLGEYLAWLTLLVVVLAVPVALVIVVVCGVAALWDYVSAGKEERQRRRASRRWGNYRPW